MCEIHIRENFVTFQWSQKSKFDFQFEGRFWIHTKFSKYMYVQDNYQLDRLRNKKTWNMISILLFFLNFKLKIFTIFSGNIRREEF